jgi:nucleoside-diphosphate-sugar epimerase
MPIASALKPLRWIGDKRMKIAVTGATGFLGRHIIQALLAHGHGAVALSRRPLPSDAVPHLPFDLGRVCPSKDDLVKLGIDGLVHCAWDFSPQSAAEYTRVNVEAARRLVDAASEGGVRRVIDISSMSAFPGCRSLYGKAKLDVEAIFLGAGGMILRPGLIWGNKAAGMVGTLDGLVKRLPVVPLIGSGGKALFLVHVEDLAQLICRIMEAPAFPARAILTAAFPEAVSLRRILEIRAGSYGLSRSFVPVPWQLVWLALRSFEIVAPGKGPRSDSVLGFIYSDTAPKFDPAQLSALGFSGFRRYGAAG